MFTFQCLRQVSELGIANHRHPLVLHLETEPFRAFFFSYAFLFHFRLASFSADTGLATFIPFLPLALLV